MIKEVESITIYSEDAKKLAGFYRDKVGMKIVMEAEMGEAGDELYGFEFGKGTTFYVVDHAKIKGANKTPERLIINFEVDDIKKEVKKLDEAKVKKIQDIYHIENYGWVSTFEDPDGNYFQLVQVRASSSF